MKTQSIKHRLGTLAVISFIAVMIVSAYTVIEKMKVLYSGSLKGDLTQSLIDMFHP